MPPRTDVADMICFLQGMAESGVVTSAKHFILNEFETNRMGSTSMGGGGGAPGGDSNSTASASKRADDSSDSSDAYSVQIDDKSFHETYLAPFYDVVKNGVGGVMCAMNRINGTYSVSPDVIR